MLIRPMLLVFSITLLFAADEKKPEPKYEMTTYIMGLLRKAPNRPAIANEEAQRIQEGHLSNIRKMAATGELIVAGPFSDDGDLRGVLIFQQTTIEEAKALVDQDPAVKAGRLIIELHPWFAAAGLGRNAP